MYIVYILRFFLDPFRVTIIKDYAYVKCGIRIDRIYIGVLTRGLFFLGVPEFSNEDCLRICRVICDDTVEYWRGFSIGRCCRRRRALLSRNGHGGLCAHECRRSERSE